MSLEATLQEDRRGLILSMLDEAQGCRLSEGSVKAVLARFGHQLSSDQVRGDLNWLKGQGLIRIDHEAVPSGTLWMVVLLEAGQDVAHGVSHPGVRRQAQKR